MLTVATLVLMVGIVTAATATALARESVDRALSAAADDPLALHELFEDDERYEYGGPLAQADTFVMLVDAEGNVYGNTTDVLVPGLPDLAALAAATGGEDLRSGRYGETHLRLLTKPLRSAEVDELDIEDDDDDDDDDDRTTTLFLQAGHDLSLQRQLEQRLLVAIGLIGLIGLAGALSVTLLVTRRALVPIREAFDTERRFVAAASHELRTPVAIIRASAEILERERLVAPGGQPLVEDIVGESDRMGRLVGDLMALASAHTGAIAMDLQPLALGAYFEDITRRSRSIAEARGRRLSTTTSGPVSEASVMADRDRLDQLLLILIDNALRHSPAAGTVQVGLAVDRSGRTATLSVSDDGPGVGLDELERIFEPFERSATARGQGEGAGLGLAIARQLAERQDAELGVESQPGAGATFRLRLKLLGQTRAG
ncbi:MAG TPA: HAMP domain-containing sensor histidine kinase [Anaerolineae bacterium]|nr:HAMP domain-containing sensor histidine kinase [Anaerolineae bacterium]